MPRLIMRDANACQCVCLVTLGRQRRHGVNLVPGFGFGTGEIPVRLAVTDRRQWNLWSHPSPVAANRQAARSATTPAAGTPSYQHGRRQQFGSGSATYPTGRDAGP